MILPSVRHANATQSKEEMVVNAPITLVPDFISAIVGYAALILCVSLSAHLNARFLHSFVFVLTAFRAQFRSAFSIDAA